MKINLISFLQLSILVLAIFFSLLFTVNYSDNMDLVRHFSLIDLVRVSDISIKEFMFANQLYGNMLTKYSYLFNLLIYIVAKCFENNYVLAYISVTVSYLIISYIYIDYINSTHCSVKNKIVLYIYGIIISFSLLPYYQVLSGVRAGMAASLTALSVYMFLVKNKGLNVYFVLMMLAIGLHAMVVTTVPFTLISKYFDLKRGLVLTLVFCISVPIIALYSLQQSHGLVYVLAYKYFEYSSIEQYIGTRFPFYGSLSIASCCSFFYLINYALNKKNILSKHEFRIYNFITLYTIFILFNIISYEMVVRSAYVLGSLGVFMSAMVYRVRINLKKTLVDILTMTMLFCLCTYISIKYIAYTEKWFVIP